MGFYVAGEGVEEEVPCWGIRADEEGFAVVGEFEFGPVAGGGRWVGVVVGGVGAAEEEVEGGEGGFVVVAEVVQEDGRRAGTGDCDDRCRGVVGR